MNNNSNPLRWFGRKPSKEGWKEIEVLLNKIEITKESTDLDKILNKCKWRISNHYGKNEWENLAKDVAGSDSNYSQHPLFKLYIKGLVEERFIEKDEASSGYIATAKGLMFEGFANREKNRKQDERRDHIRVLDEARNKNLNTKIQRGILILTATLAFGTLVAALYYTFEIIKMFYPLFPHWIYQK